MIKIIKDIHSKFPLWLQAPLKNGYRRFAEVIRYCLANLKFTFFWPFYNTKRINNINKFEQKIYSQHGEDGIIKLIFDIIGTTNKFCVEFGVEDGRECNTRYLVEKEKWNFLYMDSINYSKLHIQKETITAENINYLFDKYQVPQEFDLLSIDIDSNDYWVWRAIKKYSPRVVIIEYNGSIPITQSKTIQYDPYHTWDGTNYFGASLLALVNLGTLKGYTLIACESVGTNAFFLRNDVICEHFVIKDISQIYRPPRYGIIINNKYIGAPPSKKQMVFV